MHTGSSKCHKLTLTMRKMAYWTQIAVVGNVRKVDLIFMI